MEELLMEAVKSLNATIIIISDANSVFIDHILSTRKLTHLVGKNKEGSHFKVLGKPTAFSSNTFSPQGSSPSW
jgi:phosphoserine phosphatase